MSSDKMREEFEAWWMGGSYGMRKYDILTEAGVTEDIALEIWQASRAALAIDLPDYLDTDKLGFPAYDAAAVDAAIEAAGVKVKP